MSPSATTIASTALVEARLPAAMDLGRRLAEDIDDPAGFVRSLRAGLGELADPEYRTGLRRVAPGIGPTLGVRGPLLAAAWRAFLGETRRAGPARLLPLADAAARDDVRECRWFAIAILKRVVRDNPERAWQVFRRIGREADDWITVDSLAGAIGAAILREPYRWAELEQLVYSPSRWERRLVGSTVATIPFADRTAGRTPDVARRGLDLVGTLIGDAEPDVQKALSWALRSLVLADRAAVVAFCEREAAAAAATSDGARAWVIRDALPKVPADVGDRLRARLAGIRRQPRTTSTSTAAATAAAFAGAGLGRPLPEPPLT